MRISRTQESAAHRHWRYTSLTRKTELANVAASKRLFNQLEETAVFLELVSDHPGHLFIQVLRPRLSHETLTNLPVQPNPGFLQSIMRPVIQVSGIRKTYGSTAAVDEVSFEVNDGEIFGLIGPNGKDHHHGMHRGSANARPGFHLGAGS